MATLIRHVATGLAAILLSSPIPGTPAIVPIDGDTVQQGAAHYRLLGFDTPEIRGKCASERIGARVAYARLQILIWQAARVELAPINVRDRYGRGLAHLLIDGRDVDRIMIGRGLARPYSGGRRKRWCRPGED